MEKEKILIVCSNCQKVEQPDGTWKTDEDTRKISHGMCLPCTKKLYPDIYEKLVKFG